MHLTLGEFVLPLIKSLDTYNYLLKSHQRRAAIIAYEIGKELKLNQQQLVDLVIAASIHDLGALSVQDRDQLLEIDVSDPKPHCQMGYEILQAFQPFHNVAKIIQHHHIFYDELVMYNEDIPIQSHIIHLADRLEVYIDKDEPILDQREEIIREILDRKGTLFHPFVCGAFERVSRSSMFWLDINNKSQDWLFSQITFGDQLEVSPDIIEGFSTVMARIVDFRSRYTAAHSLTVGNVAQYIGELLQKETEYNTQLLIAGLLHDIGKFNIDPSIITKEGLLSSEEYEQMQLVPTYNQKILQDLTISPWFETVVNWISESDSTNTSGQILGTGIIELSHVITALLEDRPYREAYDIDTAVEILQQDDTFRHNPELVQFILDNKQAIEEIVNKFQSEGMDFYDNIQREFDYL